MMLKSHSNYHQMYYHDFYYQNLEQKKLITPKNQKYLMHHKIKYFQSRYN